jgi:hypothetical protein
VVVAVVIACCSYAVSATSLYALGRSSGYSWWQSAAVPIIADGPAVYGMFRIVSRSRRDARGAGYGWLLVFAGTAISIAGNVAHAQPGLIARGIAAAIPLAVLAMLEGLKGDAGEVARLAAQPASVDTLGATDTFRPGRPLVDTMTVRRTDAADTGQPVPDGQPVRQLPARPTLATSAEGSVRARLQQAFERGRPDGRVWSARSLAQAAGCGRSAAASFLHALRDTGGEGSS